MKDERTCICCAKKTNKRDLYRIVRLKDGNVLYDETGKLAGRGAYICSLECLDKSNALKRLSSSLKCKVCDKDLRNIKSTILNTE